MKIFAHRGFSGKYPENTMLAFQEAASIHADGIELDVHLTKDSKLVIIHDEALLRTSGKPGLVSDYTLEEITRISAGKTFDDKHGFTPIPSFEEYCDFIRHTDLVTNVEIKTNLYYYAQIEEKVVETLKRHHLLDQVIISSFNWLSIVRMKSIMPAMKCGLLQEGHLLQNPGLLARTMGIECYHPDMRLTNDAIVADCKAFGVGINAWTINTEEALQKAKAWDFESAITNFPDLGLKIVNG